jgi:hypothetical protein
VLKIKRPDLGRRGCVTLQFNKHSRRFEFGGSRWDDAA